ncbi:MAG: hypothetical protein SGI72_01770 [Planctomycetota bacterium]|nr:hypothetical protein [Planctomycetota bacterium]
MSTDRTTNRDGSRPTDPGWGGLCPSCTKVRVITSGKGSTFLMCKHSATDERFSKYPPQPVRSCTAFEKVER